MENKKDGSKGPILDYGLSFKIVYWVAGPVILGLILGSWIDKKFGTSPKATLISVVAFFIFSIIGLFRIFKELDQDNSSIKDKNSTDNIKKN